MKYLIFENQEAANQRNNEEAIRRGCHGVTQYWWSMTEVDGQYKLSIGEDILQEGEEAIEE